MKRLLLLLPLLACLIAPAPLSAQDDDGGTRLERLLEDLLSSAGSTVNISGFRGVLSSEATLERMTIADEDGIWLTLENAKLDWSRTALLTGRLEVAELSAERLEVARAPGSQQDTAPAPEASGGFSLPELPVSVNIGKLAITQVELGPTLLGEAVTLTLEGSAQLSDGEGTADVAIRRTDGKDGSLIFNGDYANATRQLTVDLDLSEGEGGIVARMATLPGQPSLELTLKGEGPVDDFAAALTFATDGEERLAGDITLRGSSEAGHRVDVDIAGDLRPLIPAQDQDFLGPRQELRANVLLASDGTIALDEMTLTTAVVALNGEAQIGSDGWPRLLRLDGRLASADGTPVSLPAGTVVTLIDEATIALKYDVDQGDAFTLDVIAQGLDRPDVAMREARISGRGTIDRDPEAARPGQVDGTLTFDVSGLDFTDEALAQAAGDAATGSLGFAWKENEPLYLTDIDLQGAGLELSGATTFSGLTVGKDPAVEPDLQVRTDDISRFSGLAGRPLSGAADVALKGRVEPISGRFNLVVNGKTVDLTSGIAQLDGLIAGQIDLAASMARDESGTFLRNLELKGDGLELNANAELKTDASTGAFQAALPDLSLVDPDLAGAARLSGTLEETAAAYLLDFTGSAPGSVQLDGKVTASKSDGAISAVGFDGSASARDLSIYADIAGRDIGGALEFDGTANYALASGDFNVDGDLVTQDLKVGIAEADGLLAGRTVLAVTARRAGQTIVVDRLTADGPAIELAAQGQYAENATQGTFDLSLPELSRIRPGLPGGASLNGTLSETAEAWLLDFTAAGPGSAQASGRVSAEKAGTGVGMVRFNGTAGAQSLSAFAPLVGRPLKGAVTFDGVAAYNVPDGAFDVTGQVDTLNLGVGIDIADRLLAGTGSVQLAANRDAAGTITVERLNAQTPEVTADLSGSITGTDSALRYNVALRNLGIIVEQLPGRATAEGTLSAAGSGPWQVRTAITAPGNTQAQISGSVARDFATADLSIDGSAPLSLANRITAPNLLSGPVQLNLRLNGPLSPSSLSGTVTVRNGDVVLPGPALTLTGLEIDATLSGGRVDLVVGGDISTGGRLRANGTIGLAAPYNADLLVKAREVVVQDRRLYQAELEADITVQGPLLTGPRIAGTVDVLNAEVRVPETGLGPGSRSFVLTHIAEPRPVHITRERAGLVAAAQKQGGSAYVLPLDVTINAPARIFVRGRGLDAELGGQLRVTGSTANMIPEGRFDLIRGRLDILGQRLTLSEAYLQLTGSFDPILRVVATTERDGTTITVTIEGDAMEPEVSFTSSPSRPEEEVLALLIFGRDAGQLSAFQALRLAAAVNTLSGRGGSGIVDNLRKGFGLDDLDVTTDAEGNAGLKFGKYINENLYTDVAVGSDGETEVELNFKVSPSVTARGSVKSDGNTSLGIFFERDY